MFCNYGEIKIWWNVHRIHRLRRWIKDYPDLKTAWKWKTASDSPMGYHVVFAPGDVALRCYLWRHKSFQQWKTYLPPATKLGQGYVFTRVCDSVHGGSASVHAGIPTPPGKETPWQGRPPMARRPPPGKADHPGKETPSKADPPGKADPPDKADPLLGDTVNKWAECILLECNSCCNI